MWKERWQILRKIYAVDWEGCMAGCLGLGLGMHAKGPHNAMCAGDPPQSRAASRQAQTREGGQPGSLPAHDDRWAAKRARNMFGMPVE